MHDITALLAMARRLPETTPQQNFDSALATLPSPPWLFHCATDVFVGLDLPLVQGMEFLQLLLAFRPAVSTTTVNLSAALQPSGSFSDTGTTSPCNRQAFLQFKRVTL